MNQDSIYFENNFGKIYGATIYLKEIQQEIEIKEVAFLISRSRVNKDYNGLGYFLTMVALFGVYHFQNDFIVYLCFIAFGFMSLSVAIVFKQKYYFVQVILCKIEQLNIKINKQQQNEVEEFIKSLSIYRNNNQI